MEIFGDSKLYRFEISPPDGNIVQSMIVIFHKINRVAVFIILLF